MSDSTAEPPDTEPGPQTAAVYEPAAPVPLGVTRTATGDHRVDAALGRLGDADHLATNGHRGVRGCTPGAAGRPDRARHPARPAGTGAQAPARRTPRPRTTTGAEPTSGWHDADSTPSWSAGDWPVRGSTPPAGRRRAGDRGRRDRDQVGHPGGDRRGGRRPEDDGDPDYVSRGGHKLAGALDAFEPRGLAVAGRRCLDAGASTGGFTDVLLRARRRAGRRRRRRLRPARLVAADRRPGHRADRTNVRELTPDRSTASRSTWSSADLSFISLRLVLPALVALRDAGRRPGADGQAAVRGGQGAARQRRGGPRARSCGPRPCATVAAAGRRSSGSAYAGVTASPLPGPSGNVEYFLWLRAGAPALDPADVRPCGGGGAA